MDGSNAHELPIWIGLHGAALDPHITPRGGSKRRLQWTTEKKLRDLLCLGLLHWLQRSIVLQGRSESRLVSGQLPCGEVCPGCFSWSHFLRGDGVNLGHLGFRLGVLLRSPLCDCSLSLCNLGGRSVGDGLGCLA